MRACVRACVGGWVGWLIMCGMCFVCVWCLYVWCGVVYYVYICVYIRICD